MCIRDLSRGWPKAPFSIATTPWSRGWRKFLSLDFSTLPLIPTLYCWVLSNDASSTIFESLVWTSVSQAICEYSKHQANFGLVVRVFTNGLGDRGSISGQVIPKTQKWYLIPPCLTVNIIRYGSRVNWSNPGKWVAPSPTPQCSSYWKGSLLVALDYSSQLYTNKHFYFKQFSLA